MSIEMKQEPVADSEFEKWWDEEGSIAPKHRLDCEEHCYQIAKIAWSNGAFKAHSAYTTPPAAPVQVAAVKTLEHLGYTYHGAELWKPPIGKPAPVQDECVVCGDKVRVIPRPWVGLTDEQRNEIVFNAADEESATYQTEEKLRELNGGTPK